ncbi:hypothetical protein ACQ5SO_16395 [Rhodovulum sp. DZ06]|uniref:hypothetical protein n=1 Tax=Rhodovulum sp. DZ06 TaxID=3425126 RepID=UPI003D326863
MRDELKSGDGGGRPAAPAPELKDADPLAADLAEAHELAGRLTGILARLAARLSRPVQDGLEQPGAGSFVGRRNGDWRARGWRGRPSLLDTDAELNAFVRDRVDDMTFKELAQDIARAFPPERRVSASSLHRWWHRQRKARGTGQ